jgi:hypothetical protein
LKTFKLTHWNAIRKSKGDKSTIVLHV